MISSISVIDFLKIQDKVNIIDVRIVENFNRSHIPNAINVPSDLLLANPKKYLNFQDTYYIYCQKGLTSSKLCTLLRSQGYKAINIIVGYEEYILTK